MNRGWEANSPYLKQDEYEPTTPSRGADQVIGTRRVRSISAITSSGTFRFCRRQRELSKPGAAITWAAAALISGE